MERTTILVEKDDTGFSGVTLNHPDVVAYCKASSWHELEQKMQEAIQEGLKAVDNPTTKMEDECNHSFDYEVSVDTCLDLFSPIINNRGLAGASEVSNNQIWRYQHKHSKPREAQVTKINNALNQLGTVLSRLTIVEPMD